MGAQGFCFRILLHVDTLKGSARPSAPTSYMRRTAPTVLSLLAILGSFTACVKDAEETAQDLGVLPTTCGSDGARLQASVAGTSYCASAYVSAVGEGSTIIVSGVDLTGNTLVVQMDSLVLGEQSITDAHNSVLYMQSGTPYVVVPGDPGTLDITSLDTVAHVIKASFAVTLHNEMSGGTKTAQGSLDVLYTEEE